MSQKHRIPSGAASTGNKFVPSPVLPVPTVEEVGRMSEITTYERYRLGEAYMADGDGRSAARVLEPAVEAEPASAALWLRLARAYFATTRLRRAEAAFERVVALDPTDDHARFGLGRTLERQSRNEEAAAQYRIALALAPEADYREALDRIEARLAA